jgi:hypothetical protein
MSAIRGVLLAGGFRSHHELIRMSHDDQRNTLIVELAQRTNRPDNPLSASGRRFQGFSDEQLAGLGAVYVFLRVARIRSESELKQMSDEDLRNTLIVEIAGQPGAADRLQSLDNIALVLEGLRLRVFNGDIAEYRSFVRGCLIAGGFRTHGELNQMSAEDQRNTLITEMAPRFGQALGAYSPSLVRLLQGMDDSQLSGAAASYLFLLHGGIRDADELRAMSAEDIRNTLIVEIAGQLHLGVETLQTYSTLDLVRLGLGLDAQDQTSSPGLWMPVHHPRLLQFRLHGFSEHESTDDTLQGARDEVWLDATGFASTSIMSDGHDYESLSLQPVNGNRVGDVSNDAVRGPWGSGPFVLLEFNLDAPGLYPKTFMATILAVEHDNDDLHELFIQLKDLVGEEVKNEVKKGAVAAGTAGGNAILPGWGAILGAAASALVIAAWDEMINAIDDGLANDVFHPRIEFIKFDQDLHHPNVLDRRRTMKFWENGADYTLEYDWHIHVA